MSGGQSLGGSSGRGEVKDDAGGVDVVVEGFLVGILVDLNMAFHCEEEVQVRQLKRSLELFGGAQHDDYKALILEAPDLRFAIWTQLYAFGEFGGGLILRVRLLRFLYR
jgi:hypothetical protein